MKKAALSQSDWHTINKFLAGGAAVGGGLGLVTSLANYLKNLKQEADDETTQDDSTLYVNVGAPAVEKNATEEPSLMRGGLAMTGATLGGIGAYALVRKAYQQLKKKQLQEELDSVQQVYTDMLQEEADSNNAVKRTRRGAFGPQFKSAAELEDRPMSGTEKLFSAPIALTLLMGLAAAAVTNQTLKKSFPIKTKPSRLSPKRVVVRSVPAKSQAAAEEASEMVEPDPDSYMPEKSADFHDAVEYLLDFTGSMPTAGDEVRSLVKAAAAGRHPEMRAALVEFGPDFMLDTIKGAWMDKSAATVDGRRNCMATSLISRSSTVGPVAALMAAAEFNEAFPGLTKYAAGLPDNVQVALAGVLAGYRRVQRHDIMAGCAGDFYTSDGAKSASALSGILGENALLERLLEAGLDNGKGGGQEGDDTGLQSADGENSSTDVDVQDSGAGAFADKNKDLIDQVLAPQGAGGKAPYLVFADQAKQG